jgi:hypothetical protein
MTEEKRRFSKKAPSIQFFLRSHIYKNSIILIRLFQNSNWYNCEPRKTRKETKAVWVIEMRVGSGLCWACFLLLAPLSKFQRLQHLELQSFTLTQKELTAQVL